MFYDQIDGVAIGSRLLQSLPTSLWDIMKKTDWKTIHPPKFCSIDAMLMTPVLTRKTRSCSFDYINARHQSICFTMEREIDNKLSINHPSLLVYITRRCLLVLLLIILTSRQGGGVWLGIYIFAGER